MTGLNFDMAVGGVDFLSKANDVKKSKTADTSFESIFESMMGMIDETNQLSNKAEEEEIKYAMGEDNTLDLMVAQNKANISLSYTVAVRDKIIEAYREIMNMQF